MSLLSRIKDFKEDDADDDSEVSDDDDPEMIKQALNGLPVNVTNNKINLLPRIENRKS